MSAVAAASRPELRPPGRRLPTLPLAVWIGGGAALSVALVLLAVTAALLAGSSGGLDGSIGLTLAAGLMAGVVGVSLVTAAVHALTAGLRQLQADAARRLLAPTGEPSAELDAAPRPVAVRASQELASLARTLDALHLRARVADEVARTHRRTANHASAGMFELLSGLVAAEEATRGQLSAELHDTVAQSLMLARGLLGVDSWDPQTRSRLRDYVEDAEEQVRAVMARARPPALREGDLASAVAGLRTDMARRYGLVVDLHWPARPQPLPLVSAVTVYRFFQEALLNVVKHADVDTAHARLLLGERELVALVRDEGPGFDPAQVRPAGGRHVGLGLLRERARLAGGELVVESQPSAGTTLTLRLPVTARPSALDPALGETLARAEA